MPRRSEAKTQPAVGGCCAPAHDRAIRPHGTAVRPAHRHMNSVHTAHVHRAKRVNVLPCGVSNYGARCGVRALICSPAEDVLAWQCSQRTGTCKVHRNVVETEVALGVNGRQSVRVLVIADGASIDWVQGAVLNRKTAQLAPASKLATFSQQNTSEKVAHSHLLHAAAGANEAHLAWRLIVPDRLRANGQSQHAEC